eukprot:CAMPEP_0204425468 /NCGR_PEP_ID=MMETSP0470-20130426/49251_1 /ASSEMBLY_ACC=CAM_ASM_000385 /TAXON_ID=2969 /ORGANISM="Oxyrrhis marina" /LENGTH=44 /DNA_ID= /DNA_START= /DNA_END= /DNA_ORIENTATION=
MLASDADLRMALDSSRTLVPEAALRALGVSQPTLGKLSLRGKGV